MIKSERLKKLNNDEIEKKNQFLKLITIKKNRNKKRRHQIKRKKTLRANLHIQRAKYRFIRGGGGKKR